MTYNFSEANSYCIDNFGTQLASIHNQEENDAALDVRDSTSYAWIGGTDANEEGTWVWIDGSVFNFTGWGSGQPDSHGGNQDCALLFPGDSGWDDGNCPHNANQFICNNPKYTSCSDWMYNFRSIKELSNGIYYIYDETLGVLNVYCVFDYDNNYGWTLIQSSSRLYLTSSDFIGKAFVDDVSYNIGMYFILFYFVLFSSEL